MKKKDFLKDTIEHIDIKAFDPSVLVGQFGKAAFQARNLARAAHIYDRMLADRKCAIILCLAGSIFSAGLKKVVFDMIENDMADAVVSTGAVIVDQDFFEALGYRHYAGDPKQDDEELRRLMIDRIYDTYIDEDELRDCDLTTAKIAEAMKPGAYSSREFIAEMGKYLKRNSLGKDSVVRIAYEKRVPIFVPAFSDCSAGFGLVSHQVRRGDKPKVSIDSVKDFKELTEIKIAAGETGIFMIGGGVPKNFTQDIVVAAEVLGKDVAMHKYAVQVTVADERDGGLSGSTLKEAHSWGKVDEGFEQMVFSEATIAVPLIVGYAFHKGSWKKRKAREFSKMFDKAR